MPKGLKAGGESLEREFKRSRYVEITAVLQDLGGPALDDIELHAFEKVLYDSEPAACDLDGRDLNLEQAVGS
jgi:hypothetical protein